MGLKKYFIIVILAVAAYHFIGSSYNFHYSDDLIENIVYSKITMDEIEKLKPLANQLRGKDDYETVWNIIFWQEDNIRYDYSKLYNNHYVQSPTETLQLKRGVCIDYAILTACLLLAMDKDAYIFVVDGYGNTPGHAFAGTSINDMPYALDEVAPITDVNSNIKRMTKEYPNLNLSTMRVYHLYIFDGKLYINKMNWYYVDASRALTPEQKKEIEEAIINHLSKKYRLSPSSKINNMENMRYLPYRFREGVYYYVPFDGNLYVEFKEQYGRWIDRVLSGHVPLSFRNKVDIKPVNFNEWKYIWVKVDDKGGMGVIYIYLAK